MEKFFELIREDVKKVVFGLRFYEFYYIVHKVEKYIVRDLILQHPYFWSSDISVTSLREFVEEVIIEVIDEEGF